MVYTVQDYEREPEALTVEQAQMIHEEIKDEVDDDKAFELYDKLVKAGVEYIQIRAKWAVQTREENHKMNDLRTEKHNAVIAAVDALADYLKSQDKPAAWRDEIGYEANGKFFRKRIGDFGCYIAFLVSLKSR